MRTRIRTWQRAAVTAAAVVTGLTMLGCPGGGLPGTNPADGACSPRPDGLIVDDITGIWEGGGNRFTLRLDGTAAGKAYLVPPWERSAQPSASAQPSTGGRASGRPARSGRPSPTPSFSPGAPLPAVEATWHWKLLPKTNLRDLEFSDFRSDQGPASLGGGSTGFFVGGTRREPFLYVLDYDGDPDDCNILKYARTSRG